MEIPKICSLIPSYENSRFFAVNVANTSDSGFVEKIDIEEILEENYRGEKISNDSFIRKLRLKSSLQESIQF